MPIKDVLSVVGLVNHPETPKLWATVHENGSKTQKQGYATQTCTKCHGPCKSPHNLKTVGYSSPNGHKRKNDEFFFIPL
jgi:hypothetical protein